MKPALWRNALCFSALHASITKLDRPRPLLCRSLGNIEHAHDLQLTDDDDLKIAKFVLHIPWPRAVAPCPARPTKKMPMTDELALSPPLRGRSPPHLLAA